MIRSSHVIQGRGLAQFLLPNGTMFQVTYALYTPSATRTLLSFRNIRDNGFHIETHCENGIEYFYITSNECGRKRIFKKLMSQSSGLYLITIRIVESYAVINNEMWDTDSYRLWHDRLGHPGHDMMIRILKNSHGHPLFRVRNKRGQQSNTLQGVGLSTAQSSHCLLKYHKYYPPLIIPHLPCQRHTTRFAKPAL